MSTEENKALVRRWFEGMTITLEDGDTLLSGPVVDQAALHGLLKKVRDLGGAAALRHSRSIRLPEGVRGRRATRLERPRGVIFGSVPA